MMKIIEIFNRNLSSHPLVLSHENIKEVIHHSFMKWTYIYEKKLFNLRMKHL